ncbi:glycosyltransferase family 2 protein [Chryseobacterium sp. DT-3]|uniref:glycosyltransferase family 2 protein n=1 Tax=Chryseobacterium sp. DT-3 TaxID=3396164 RepID=UPI003F19C871
MMFDVSVIVPIYNVANYIERCLISLFSQTHDSIEYIFVDDGTPDNSIEILYQVMERFPERKNSIKIIRHEKNKGLSAARITGISNASGEYIHHVDSDDFVDVNMIELMMKSARANNSDIVFCDVWIEWLNKRKQVIQEFTTKEQYLIDLLESRVIQGVFNKLVRKKLYIDNNIFPTEGINVGEDLIVTPRLIYYADIITKVDDALYYYVQYNAGSYTKHFKIKTLQDVSYVLDFLREFFSKPSDKKYLDALEVGTNRKKMQYLTQVDLRNVSTVMSYFPLAYNKISSNKFTFIERLILTLSEANLFFLKIFLFFYGKMFSAWQITKRRN